MHRPPLPAARRPPHTEIPRPKRGEGQWALGYSEPLNKNEQSKKDDNPLNVRDRILHIYSKRGFDSIDPADLRGRFRWMGLYTQRAPGFDGGKTAMLEEEELDDSYFMMRVRCDGRCSARADLRALGEHRHRLRPRHRRHHRPREHPVPLDRHRGRPRDLGAARRRRAQHAGGLRRLPAAVPRLPRRRGRQGRDHRRHRRAGGDQAPLHRQPGVLQPPAQVQDLGLRPPSLDGAPEINDVSFVGIVHPEHGPGFDLWVGGGLSTNPMLAQKLGVWIPLEEVAGRLGGRDLDLPRLRLPPAALARPPEVPGRRLGRGEVPRGPRERVPRPRPVRRPRPRSPSATATTSACTSRRTAGSTSASRRPPAGCPAPAGQLADAMEEYAATTTSTRHAPIAASSRW